MTEKELKSHRFLVCVEGYVLFLENMYFQRRKARSEYLTNYYKLYLIKLYTEVAQIWGIGGCNPSPPKY
jgi:hypothetical protein